MGTGQDRPPWAPGGTTRGGREKPRGLGRRTAELTAGMGTLAVLSGIMGMGMTALALAGLGFLVPELLGATWRRKAPLGSAASLVLMWFSSRDIGCRRRRPSGITAQPGRRSCYGARRGLFSCETS
jgi:hypothetical protein